MTTQLERLVAESQHALGSPGDMLFSEDGGKPRFTLFHASNSICSQKVRVVLAQHRIGHIAYGLDLFSGQTYLPSHVRLRMLGCESLGLPLMTTHTGSTSVTAGGCDPAVVPTLIDWHTKQVIVDSKRICSYLDDLQLDSQRLSPTGMRPKIDGELAIVDNLPNYQMLNGQAPGEGLRSGTTRGRTGTDIANRKVARLDAYLADHANDPTLVRAYTAKRSKELEGGKRLFTEEAMIAAYVKARRACEDLERKLQGRKTRWLFTDSLTMADLFWAVELLRMKNLGSDTFWKDGALPAVETFVSDVETLPAIRSAVLDWKGALY